MPALTPLRLALLVFATLLLSAWGRAWFEGARYAERAAVAEQEERREDAVLEHRRAAQWYAPGSPYPRASLERLLALGDEAAAAGDVDAALVAWRNARIAILSTRWLVVPNEDLLPRLHERIGQAMAVQAARGAVPDAARADAYRAQLDAWRTRQPNPWLGLLASLGFGAWLLTLGGLAWRSWDERGQWQRAVTVRWASANLVCAAVWMLAVRFA